MCTCVCTDRIDSGRSSTNSSGMTAKIQYIEIDLNHQVPREVLQTQQLASTACFEGSFRKPRLVSLSVCATRLRSRVFGSENLGVSPSSLAARAQRRGTARHRRGLPSVPAPFCPATTLCCPAKLNPLYFIPPLVLPPCSPCAWQGRVCNIAAD